MPAASPQLLRKDAQRNRDAIFVAAKELFAESGDVPMYEIARRAGVGQATLYRHFPDRSAVAVAIADEQLDGLERIADDHRDDPDCFFALIRGVVDAQVRCHGLVDILREAESGESELEVLKHRFACLLEGPLDAAKATRGLRRDLSIDDVFLLNWMIDGVLREMSDPSERAAAADRALTLALEGLT